MNSTSEGLPVLVTKNGVRVYGAEVPRTVEKEQPDRVVIAYRMRAGEDLVVALDRDDEGRYTFVGVGPAAQVDPILDNGVNSIVTAEDADATTWERMLNAALVEWNNARFEYRTGRAVDSSRYGRACDRLDELLHAENFGSGVVQPLLYGVVMCGSEGCSRVHPVSAWTESSIALVTGQAGVTASNPIVTVSPAEACPACGGVRGRLVRVVRTAMDLNTYRETVEHVSAYASRMMLPRRFLHHGVDEPGEPGQGADDVDDTGSDNN